MPQFAEELYVALEGGVEVAAQSGDVDAAVLRGREAVSYFRAHVPADDPSLADALSELAFTLVLSGKFPEAELAAREDLAIQEKKQPDGWKTFSIQFLLGDTLLGQRKYTEAEPLLVSGYEGVKQHEAIIPTHYKPRLKEGFRSVAQLYSEMDQPAKAAEWMQRTKEFGATAR